MDDILPDRILSHVKSEGYQPQRPRRLARQMQLGDERQYPAFREALKQLMRDGRVMLGAGGSVVMPAQHVRRDVIVGTYRQNRKGFGFVVPTDPDSHEDLYIGEGDQGGAISGDVVSAKIVSSSRRGGKQLFTGRIIEVIERTHKRFVGTLAKQAGRWVVIPDGNLLTAPIDVADAGSRHSSPGTKVVVELTEYPDDQQRAQGVITEVLGQEGEKDVDLRGVVIQHNLPERFSEQVLNQARSAIDSVDWNLERSRREDLTGETIVTIDPDDAKDYDDAISLKQVDGGYWELGVHIADVARFVPEGSPLDDEAELRGNSSYFPGFVIPMLPVILSNGVCSLQEGVERLCKSAFITLDDDARPVRTRFANSLIKSAKRLRYTEAQALIDGTKRIPHPDGEKHRGDYPAEVLELLTQMNALARRIQKRRLADGQLVLQLPEIELVLDENGAVVDAKAEDTSFTHTVIEMFMVEANEAVARLLSQLHVPFLRRVHPGPGEQENVRLRGFIGQVGYKLPKELDRKAIQTLLDTVRDRPESYTVNLAILKSLSRAEYSPEETGHFALASEDYCHFTSPIRRYADLTIHRLFQRYVDESRGGKGHRKSKLNLDGVPSFNDLVELGRHISFTERRSESAERELRRIKVLTLLQDHIGETYAGVVTGVTNFGVFIQLQQWLIEGLIRYEQLMDDWWDVNENAGEVTGRRSGVSIRIGDIVKAAIAQVDVPRRELDLGIVDLPRRGKQRPQQKEQGPPGKGEVKRAAGRAPGQRPKHGPSHAAKRRAGGRPKRR